MNSSSEFKKDQKLLKHPLDGINTKSHIINNYMHALRLVKVNFSTFNGLNTSLSFRLSVVKSFVRSSWEYGFQICNFSKSGIKCVESLQHYFLTKLLSISIYTNKNTIRSYLNVEDVYFRLRTLQLKFFRRSYIYNRFNRMCLYNFSNLLCCYIGRGNYDIALKQSTMYGPSVV